MSPPRPDAAVEAVRWRAGLLELLDQRVLPGEVTYLKLDSAAAVAAAITDMVVRGAPAIGIAGAYGVVLSVRAALRARARGDASWRDRVAKDCQVLAATRPTAVNLAWALARMQARLAVTEAEPVAAMEAEAAAILTEDIAANRRMGDLGAELIAQRCAVLTHCNAGALATGGYGTALGVVRSAYAQGKIERVLADETRPWLQGARLTAWELAADGIPVDLIADAAASYAMRQGNIGWVIVGADRVAANGDVANKIGTYSLAVAARYHGVRFMVVAPISTIDPDCASGDQIPIEQRSADELLNVSGKRQAPAGVGAWNPVFDVTPAELVDVLVTERGVLHAPDRAAIAALLAGC